MKVYGLLVSPSSWLTHKPLPVVETSAVKILWDFSSHSASNRPSNRPDIVLFDYLRNKVYFIEKQSCPADIKYNVRKIRRYISTCH